MTSTTRTRHGSAVVTLPSDREIRITRAFDAPAALVFKAWTTPEFVRRWWGFESVARWWSATSTCGSAAPGATSPARPTAPSSAGTAPTARSMPRTGWCRPRCSRATPTARRQNTLTLDRARRHHRRSTVTVLHTSKENRDGHVDSGMEGGMQLTLDRLEDLLAELQTCADASVGAPP